MKLNRNTIKFITNVSFLKKLPENSLNIILEHAIVRNVKKDEVLYIEGEPARKFFIILCGTCKLYSETINGSESVTRLLGNGDFFGERSLSDHPNYSSSAEATRNSQILEIPADILKQQIQLDQTTGLIILQELINCQTKLESQIEYLSVMNAPQRIGWYLINSVNKDRSLVNISSKINLQHDKSLIATFLGMKPETFSRAIKKLKEAKVFVKGPEIVINDIDLLYKYCTDKIEDKAHKGYNIH